MVNTTHCIICKLDKENLNPNNSLFSFPTCNLLRLKWIKSLNLTQPIKTSEKVCEKHFRKEDRLRTRLKKNAVPVLGSLNPFVLPSVSPQPRRVHHHAKILPRSKLTPPQPGNSEVLRQLFPVPVPSAISSYQRSFEGLHPTQLSPVPVLSDISSYQHSFEGLHPNQLSPVPVLSAISSYPHSFSFEGLHPTQLSPVPVLSAISSYQHSFEGLHPNQQSPVPAPNPTPSHQFTFEGVLPNHLFPVPVPIGYHLKCDERYAAKLKLNSIRLKRERQRRKRLENRVKELKKKLAEKEDIKKVFAAHPTFRRMIEAQISRYKHRRKPYSTFEKTSALSIYYSSGPNGYDTLLKMGFKLPTKRTLLMWMSEFKISTGINRRLLECIQEVTTKFTAADRDCIITWDEMSIKEFIEFNRFYDMFEGVIDFAADGRHLDSATEVLVFMVRGINSNWKFPISYYFSKNATPAETLLKLLIDNVRNISTLGLKIRMGICDMSFTNQKLYRLLGVTDNAPFSVIENKKIYFIHDTPHLFKLVRNNLMKHDFIFNGRTIKWSHIVNFYKKDSRVVSRLAPRLTKAHIYLKDYSKMKVKLAVQVLSHSVYAGIASMCLLKILTKDYLDTGFFVKKMDEIFDFLNMSCLTKDKWGRCAKYFYRKLNLLDEYTKFVSGISIPSLNKYPEFLRGLKLTLQGIKRLAIDLKLEGYSHILTRNLQQDCLERFFSDIRSKGGNCRNPTARQFRCCFRFLFFAKLIRTRITGNTQSYDDDEQLDCYVNMSNALQRSGLCDRGNTGDGETARVLRKSDAASFYSIKVNRRLKLGHEQEASVASYLGGAAIHAFLKRKNCDQCQKLLHNKSDVELNRLTDYIFIDTKEFDPHSTHLVYLDSETASVFQHVNKQFPKYCTESLTENGTGVISGILQKYMLDDLVSVWLSLHQECLEHRKSIILYILRAKLYRVIKDKNDNLRQVKFWEQTRREQRNQ